MEKKLQDFYKSLENIKVPKKQQEELVTALTNSKKAFNRLEIRFSWWW